MKTTTVDLLRHGEVRGGARYRGRTDDPLTEQGLAQMRRQTADWRGDFIVSSPLLRCLEFAQELSRRQNVPLRIDDNFQEIDFGDWEGKTAEQINDLDSSALRRYYDDPARHPPPNGENQAAFRKRVDAGWQRILDAYPGRRVLVVTHAGVIRTLFLQILDVPFSRSLQIEIGHACLSRFKCYHGDNSRFVQLSFHLPL